MRVLLDSNVVLDVFLDRAPWVEQSRIVWQANDDGRIAGHVSASSMTDIYYIVRREAGLERAGKAVKLLLAAFGICEVNRTVLQNAIDRPGADFEDNVQIACAQAERLDAIITRDKNGFATSQIPVFTPAEFLQHLNTPKDAPPNAGQP